MPENPCWSNFKNSKLFTQLMEGKTIDWDGEGTPPKELIDHLNNKKQEALNNLEDIHRQIGIEPPKDTVDEGGETVGISHERQKERAEKLEEALPERGKGLNVKEAIQRGKTLIEQGKNPDEAAKKFKEETAISEDAMALVRYKYNELAKATKDAYGKPEYKEAKAAERKWYNEVVKPMQTAWSNIGKTMQGATDIDTGDVVDLSRSFENVNGKEPNEKQTKELKDLSDRYSKLQKEFDELRKSVSNPESVKEKGKYEKAFKKAADTFRKLKSKPITFKDENGNDVPVNIQGISWNDLVELGAKAIEKTGQIVDGINAIVDRIKDTDWYKGLSQNDKNRLEKQLTEQYQKELDNTPEAKNIKRLEKHLEDLRTGKIKQTGEKRELSDKEKQLQDEIFEAKKNLGLVSSKVEKQLTEQERKEQQEKIKTELQQKFVDKKDNVFEPKDAKEVWDYINNQIEDGTDFDEAVGKAATDLGLSTSQVQHAIASSKTLKNTTDKLYKNQYERNKLQRNAKLYIQAEGNSLGIKILKAITAIPRGLKVFGHGTVPMETHVGMSKFETNPKSAKIYWQHVIKTYKLYGSSVYYEKAMQALKNDPNFHLFNRMGLHNDPDVTYQDYLLNQTWFKKTTVGKLQEASRRGFDILKPYRQARMQYYFDRLSKEEKKDEDLLRLYTDMVNHESGSIKPIFRAGSTAGEIAEASTFALKLEGSRWASLKDNFKALGTLANYKNATPAEKVRAKMLTLRAARIVGGYMGALAMNQAMLLATGSNQRVNFLNPTKADWLNFKMFGKTVGLSSGMQGVFRFITNMFRAPFLSKKDLKGKNQLDAMKDYSIDYARGKASPAAGDLIDLASHHDYSGNTLPFFNDKPLHLYNHKLSVGEYAMKYAPIPVEGAYDNIKQSMENNGIEKLNVGTVLGGLAAGVMEGATGIRVQEDFKPKPPNYSDEQQKDKRVSWVKDDWKMELPNTVASSEDITKEDEAFKDKLNTLPQNVQDNYKENHFQNLAETLGNIHDNGTVFVKHYHDSKGNPVSEVSLSAPKGDYDEKSLKQLTDNEKAQVLHLAQAQATTKTKKDMFNQ